jgi:hypothetical protein
MEIVEQEREKCGRCSGGGSRSNALTGEDQYLSRAPNLQ